MTVTRVEPIRTTRSSAEIAKKLVPEIVRLTLPAVVPVLELSAVIAGGEAVLCAARVEPHVAPGQIWATEEFRAQLAERPSLWRTTPVTSPDGAGEINVKKAGGTEPDLWVRLHRLEF